MNSETIVSDASPLIALDRIGRLDILVTAYERVLIPPAVRQEIGAGLAGHPWVVERSLTRPIDPRIVAADLGAGESEAISLAIEPGILTVMRPTVDSLLATGFRLDPGLLTMVLAKADER